MHFYLIIALQAFCIYHLFKNRNDYYWVFIILFLPIVGSIIYLITQVYNKRDAKNIQNEIVTIINPTKKIKDLEKKLEFSETFQNRVDLADAYLEIGDYEKAIFQYEKSLKDNFQNDIYVIKQLIKSYSEQKEYEKVINYSERILDKPEFKKTHFQFLYGLALENVNRLEEAETNLMQIDISFSNYEERLYLVNFLLKLNKKDKADELLKELSNEFKHMRNETRRKYKNISVEVERMIKNKPT